MTNRTLEFGRTAYLARSQPPPVDRWPGEASVPFTPRWLRAGRGPLKPRPFGSKDLFCRTGVVHALIPLLPRPGRDPQHAQHGRPQTRAQKESVAIVAV